MSLTNKDLLSISQLLDSKLKPVNTKTSNIELLLENDTFCGITTIILNLILQSSYRAEWSRSIKGLSYRKVLSHSNHPGHRESPW